VSWSAIRAGTGRTGAAVRLLALILVFGAAFGLGRSTQEAGTDLSLVWPAAGVAFLWLASGWHRPRQRAVDLAAIAVVATLGNLVTGATVPLAVIFGLTNAGQGLMAVVVYRRRRHGRTGWALDSVADLWSLVLASAAGAVASSAVGPLYLVLGTGAPPLETWATYALRNTVSSLVVAAVGLLLLTGRRRSRGFAAGPAELVALTVATLATAVGVFAVNVGVPIAFLPLPVAVWAGTRLRTTAATLLMAAVGVFAVTTTLAGRGPFAGASPTTRVVLAQLLVGLLVIVTMLLGLGEDERARLVREQTRTNADLLRARERADVLWQQASIAVIEGTPDGIITTVNDSLAALLGHRPEDLVGAPASALADPAFTPEINEAVGRLRTGHGYVAERRYLTKDGRSLPVLVSTAVLHDETGAVDRFAGFVVDMSELHAQRSALAAARDQLQGVLDAATEQAIIGTDADGQIIVFSHGAERMTGWSESQALGRDPGFLHEPDEVAERAREVGVDPGFAVFVHGVVPGDPDTRDWTYLTRDRRRITVRLTISAVAGAQGATTGYLGVATDVTGQVQAERALADSELVFRSAFTNAPVGMLRVALDPADPGRVIGVNPRMCELMGLREAELLGIAAPDLLHPVERAGAHALLASLAASHDLGYPAREAHFLRPDGAGVWGAVSGSVVRPGSGAPFLLLIVEDVTARRAAEEQLTIQALHDHLTGLPNRALLVDRLQLALDTTSRTGDRVGVLYLDLDGFKEVNDSGGHGAGDALLVQVANRLADVVRPSDTVARLGGDEFAIVCPDLPDGQTLRRVADRVLAAIDRPFDIDGQTYQISVSVGLVVAKGDDDLERLLASADETMYSAKRAGKNRIAESGTETRVRVARSTRLLPELARAMREGQIVLHGQPVVDLASGAVVAVETLIRWQHPERGLLPPKEFLDVLETSALMVPMGRHVLEESCRMGASWAELLGPGAPSVHVNVSGRQLESGNLSRDVLEVLSQTSLPADRLVLELTETHMPMLADSLRTDLSRLRDRGVRIAMDDIGTGYSSLTRLTELPVDILKIDLRFIAGLGTDPRCDAVVRAVLGISEGLGMSVVAEGIETPQQLDRLQRMGCDTGQGYLFSAARPEHDLLAALRTWPEHRVPR
jgi:diguanylate cyclase (GGDEF)-like protein/PAS domain S-box-containing protein